MSNICQFPRKQFVQEKNEKQINVYLNEIKNLSQSIFETAEKFQVDTSTVLLDLMYYQVGKEIQDAICTD